MKEHIFPIGLGNLPIVLKYDSENDLWYSSEFKGEIINVSIWLEFDIEAPKCYLNMSVKDKFGRDRNRFPEPLNGITITPTGVVIPLSLENGRCYFSLEFFDKNEIEYSNFKAFPILLWGRYGGFEPIFIPERENLYIDERKEDPERKSYFNVLFDLFKQKLEAKKEQAQKQKEQTEREWDEWEENQK